MISDLKRKVVDGHERPDVVRHRETFLQSIQEFCQKYYQWEGPELEVAVPPRLGEGESLFYTNDSCIPGRNVYVCMYICM